MAGSIRRSPCRSASGLSKRPCRFSLPEVRPTRRWRPRSKLREIERTTWQRQRWYLVPSVLPWDCFSAVCRSLPRCSRSRRPRRDTDPRIERGKRGLASDWPCLALGSSLTNWRFAKPRAQRIVWPPRIHALSWSGWRTRCASHAWPCRLRGLSVSFPAPG